jgi:hypothetical protein
MSFEITEKTRRAISGVNVKPSLVLEIEGVDSLFGAVRVLRLIRIGDAGLEIGDDWRIGGATAIEDQEDIVSIDTGNATQISQQLQPDKGSVSSVSSIQIALVDRRQIVTQLISPGVLVDDILGRKATLWIGFQGTTYKQDFIPIFSGIIDETDAGAGQVILNIAHPEQLKRQDVFVPVDLNIAEDLDDTETSITLDAGLVDNMLFPVAGPDGSTLDDAIRFYIQVEDEIIRYTGHTGDVLTGCVRGELGTAAAAHTRDGDGNLAAKTLVKLEGPAIELALKLMLSGVNGPYAEDVAITRYLHPTPFTTVDNSIFFEGIDLNRDYGVVAGDYVTITGATNGANNCTRKQILEIEVTDDGGSYAIIDDVTFVEELTTSAVISFRSQYDTLGEGLGMTPDQVDVTEHVFWNDFNLASFSLRFNQTEKISGKEFLDKEIYMPIGAYSLPRQGRCSMGYHVGSVIRGDLKVFNKDNIKDPDKIIQKRTTNRNFYNTIIYKFDLSVTSGKYGSGSITRAQDSIDRIPVGTKAFTVQSAGIRRDLGGTELAESVSGRYLARYKFAAEFYEEIGVFFKDSFNLEPGDPVLIDFTDLKVPNLADGTRNKPAKVYTVINKKIDLKTGDCKISVVDANFDLNERYGSISPSSLIVSGTTGALIIEDSFGSIFPGHESRKWEDYLGLPIRVHSPDYTFDETVILASIDPANRYRLVLDASTPLSLAPSAGYIIDIAEYPEDTDPNINALYKAVHFYISRHTNVNAATPFDSQTSFTVADPTGINVGNLIRAHDSDFTLDSGEVRVESVVGDLITTEDLGFVPAFDTRIENLSFDDGGPAYRIF